MFSYYSTLILLAISAQFIMLTFISSDHLLPNKSKKYFSYAVYSLMCISISEWCSVYFSEINTEYIILKNVSTFFMQILSPLLPLFVGLVFKKYEFKKLIYALLVVNVIIHSLVLFEFAYISELNIHDIKNMYILDNAIFIICLLLMFWNVYSVCRKYESSHLYIVVLIVMSMIFANNFRTVNSVFRVAWIAGTAGLIFMYAYYSALVNKIDSLTHLLNKRCFNSRFINLSEECYIVVIDLNKFKQINDEQGHVFGDYILKEIADIIQRSYHKQGTCFRIGGDEFCVIVKKEANIENLNSQVNRNIEKRRLKEPLLPSVSIGYSKLVLGVNTQEDAFEEADKMMFKVKENSKKS